MMSLAIVSAVLRDQRDSNTPQLVSAHISSFLGPPPCLSLSQACSFGSTTLLDWIWDSSCTSAANRPSTWSLHNYLRSDPHYYLDQFNKSLEVAVHRNKLAIVKWLFSHFSCLEVPTVVVKAATSARCLPILQFFLANDIGCEGEERRSQKKRKVVANDGEIKAEKHESSEFVAGHVIHWNADVMMSALETDDEVLVRWLHENMPEIDNGRDIDREIRFSLRNGDNQIAKIIMPRGRCLLDYASCASVKMIELLLDCRYIKRDQGLANEAIESLARLNRLDLMQQVVLLHSPPHEDQSLCLHSWWGAITSACSNGYLEMLQWLLDHPLWLELRASMKSHRKYSYLVRLAAQNDQAGIMQYLYEQGADDEIGGEGIVREYAREMMIAIRDDRCNTVKWMVQNISFPESGPSSNMAIKIAVRFRRFNILKLFHELGSSNVIDLTQNEDNRADQVTAWWSRSQNLMDSAGGCGRVDMFQWLLENHPQEVSKDAMDRAAGGGHLEMVQWLHANRSEGCTKKAMDAAATRGHFDMVKWLHVNRSEGCSEAAMDGAAGNGHLEIVKWLDANRSEGCTKKAMDGAARNGHLSVVKWLYANRSEGCSAEAIQSAVNEGHLAVLNWLHQHYPEHVPTAIDKWVGKEKMFEVLLFLQAHFPQVITPKFTADVRQYNINRVVSAWLVDN
ncbi:hypothetical protein PPTG_12752 [Phytophthora nicotianae INRA-310]|uniref:Ankyrin repeat-containing domain n=1 Tax=Phytophthora nicotianae (strain INRA-310) TaxID=761204 RepID=W2Q2B1_PHYN3|nr:hypothetical protein PPTG_12752 [Phytophthora nicotianae INRA-310]ETN06709.1 hypothetical protein PPTG_12752 [Phytophthora nicotianae INRA-310]